MRAVFPLAREGARHRDGRVLVLCIRGLCHSYGDKPTLQHIDLDLEPGEILCLLGPSGCGKTTLLRIIAGLEPEYSGLVQFAGQDMRAIPTHRRGFGLMFQEYALFPHMTVAGNVAYGLRGRGLTRKQIMRELMRLLERVGLAGYGERDVASLSGGQRQRTALARSLAPRPRLFMLDEPLGSLDAQLRDHLAQELRRLLTQQGLSALYVTHDHREAYAVADRIAVMAAGKVQQVAPPRTLYAQPANVLVARFLGLRNLYALASSPLAQSLAPAMPPDAEANTLLVHPTGIHLHPPQSRSHLIRGRLTSAIFRGAWWELTLALDEPEELVFTVAESQDFQALQGADMTVHIAPGALVLLPDA